jgi:hypothetical protein
MPAKRTMHRQLWFLGRVRDLMNRLGFPPAGGMLAE